MFSGALARIVSIEGRILSVKPIGQMGGISPPVIHDVPLGLLGNRESHSDYGLKIGDIIPVMFITMDISDYVAFGGTETVSNIEMNSYNSCIAFPLTFNKADFNLSLPTSIRTVGDNEQDGGINTTKLIHSDEDVTAKTVSLDKHIHKNTKPGNDTEFSGPPKQ